MGEVLRGNATTTEAIGRAIQNSQVSLRVLSKRYGINQKTVAKWQKRASVIDLHTGPKPPCSTALASQHEAAIIAFRKHTQSFERSIAWLHSPMPENPLRTLCPIQEAQEAFLSLAWALIC